ncbi:hypothetical protein Q3G72_020280 [Acer saccharum]|nr:hypothetical protein Q3G72_020280 [Acer saccharum]
MDFNYVDYMLTDRRKGEENLYESKLAKSWRYIPQSFEKTFDAPDIQDNFYLNLLDWGCSNVLAIAIDGPITSVSWDLDGRHIAIGLNNSHVQIWDSTSIQKILGLFKYITQWLHILEDYTTAVKALAWCPFQGNLPASGGGGCDKCIKFWNTHRHTGACLNSVDIGSQVCALMCSIHEQELLNSYGFLENQLTFWKYLSMVNMAELTGYTSRVLFMAQSPDGYTVASAAGDETL